jgi:uncharacterized coiled-coil protein SlyX
METLSTVNSFLRTILSFVVVGALGVGSWFGYNVYNENEITQATLLKKDTELAEATADLKSKEEELVTKRQMIADQDVAISDLNDDVRQKQQQIERLNTAIALLKVDHRLAMITVLDQITDPETGVARTSIAFTEVNEQGEQIDSQRQFEIDGDVVYVDYWVVKFEDRYIEQSDLLRATSLCLFRRIFGERQEPRSGFILDEVGSRPNAYACGSEISDFEQQIWEDFWNIAHDPEQARQLGIRAAHGEAVSTQLRKGKQYRLVLRASGGLSITPAEDANLLLPPAA